MFQTCGNQNTHFMFWNLFLLKRAIYEIMWKYILESERSQLTIQYGAHARLKRHTQKCNTRCHSAATMVRWKYSFAVVNGRGIFVITRVNEANPRMLSKQAFWNMTLCLYVRKIKLQMIWILWNKIMRTFNLEYSSACAEVMLWVLKEQEIWIWVFR